MRVGIFGGTFDPVHVGHLAIANAALESVPLDRVVFVLARRSPLKDRGPVAAEAFAEGTNVRGIVLARGLMTAAELDDALRHEVLTQPRAYERAQRPQ